MWSFFQLDKESFPLPLWSQWLWDSLWPLECSMSGTVELLTQASWDWLCSLHLWPLGTLQWPYKKPSLWRAHEIRSAGLRAPANHQAYESTLDHPAPAKPWDNCSSMSDLRWDSQQNCPAKASPECRIMNNCFKSLNLGFVIQQLVMDITSKINTYFLNPFFFLLYLALFILYLDLSLLVQYILTLKNVPLPYLVWLSE